MIAAHPFGDPQTIEVSRDGGADTVHINWKVGAVDDLTLLGIHLEVLPEERVMLDGAIAYDEGDAALMEGSVKLEPYLLDHIAVTTGDASCVGELQQAGDLVEHGAELQFTCPGPVDEATVKVTTLTDMHEAYRTLASGADGQRRVYEVGTDTHVWSLPEAGTAGTSSAQSIDTGASAALQMGGVLGAVLLVAVAGAFVVRRRRATATPQ